MKAEEEKLKCVREAQLLTKGEGGVSLVNKSSVCEAR